MKKSKNVNFNIIGGGFAGCEAANYIASKGYKVNLYDMKPKHYTAAHKSEHLCELVCSNSFKSTSLINANGLLKKEIEILGSIVIETAYENRIPAGGALAVDREEFSKSITKKLNDNKSVNVISERIDCIKDIFIKSEKDGYEYTYMIIATGPLTSDELARDISKLTEDGDLYFFDAVSPGIMYQDIDFTNAYCASRYDANDTSYINCPLTKEQYDLFHSFIINAKTVPLKEFETVKVFEGCIPFEVLAKRGYDALRFGPMKPVGLINPHTNEKDFAVIQLRQENVAATIYNLVGFQTNLTFDMQKKMLKLVPALKNSKIVRYGVMHRNTYINSPQLLNKYYQLKSDRRIFFAGQITGVEGYIPCAASGLTAAINCVKEHENKDKVDFSTNTIIGALQNHISTKPGKQYLPMNANFGIIEPPERHIRKKTEKYEYYAKRSFDTIESIKSCFNL